MLISIKDHEFELHPLGVIYWKAKETLLIADVHLGKIAHFRKHGSAIPQEATLKNYELLDKAVAYFEPKKIYFLGDLFHSHMNNEWALWENWRKKHPAVKMLLIVGNHDIISPTAYHRIGVQTAEKLIWEEFLFTHHPEIREGYFNFCGHIHPGVVIKGIGKQKIRVACFFQKQHQMMLPAFGFFTGKHTMPVAENSNIYGIMDNEVIPIPNELCI